MAHDHFFQQEEAMERREAHTIPQGATVYDAIGDKVGTVVRTEGTNIIVKRGGLFGRTILVPIDAVTGVDEREVRLSASKADVINGTVMPSMTNGLPVGGALIANNGSGTFNNVTAAPLIVDTETALHDSDGSSSQPNG